MMHIECSVVYIHYFFFFFQAEDGIRDYKVTGVQTCALPICLTRATRWDAVPDYIRTAHEQLCLIVQIESPRGVAHAAEIAAVEGVDAVFIGPADLSTGMGHAGDASQGEVQEAIRRTVQATLAAGKACGILAPREEDARRYADWGRSEERRVGKECRSR